MKTLVFAALTLAACCGTDSRPRTIESGKLVELLDSTAALVERGPEGAYHVFCSAVWIGPQTLLTAAHCVEGAGMSEEERFLAEMLGVYPDPTGREVTFLSWRATLARKEGEPIYSAEVGTVRAYDQKNDLALVTARALSEHAIATLGESPTQGDVVHVVGHTLGQAWSYTPGVVGAVRYRDNVGGNLVHVLQIVSGSSFGNSGGAAFDPEGRVVGIASYLANGSILTYFVHVDVLRPFVSKS